MDPEAGQIEVGVGSSKENLEPLLSKSEVLDEGGAGKADDQPPPPLPYYPGSGFVNGPRPYRDIAATIIFVIFVLASVAWGIFCIVNHNEDYGLVDSALYNSTSGLCYSYSGYSSGSARIKELIEVRSMSNWQRVSKFSRSKGFLSSLKLGWTQVLSQKSLGGSFTTTSFVTVLVWTLVLTLVLSIPFIFGFLWLLKTFAKQLVYACLPFFILIPVFLNVFWFVACIMSSECQESFSLAGRIALFIFVFILCGIFAWIIYSNWDRVELTIKIMQTSAQALFSNWMLLLILPSLSLVLLIYIVPFIVFLIYAYMNGEIVGTTSSTYCQGEAATDCCSWSVDKWVPAYYVLTIFTVLWSILVMTEAQVYVLSSTIAQWYFAVSGSKVTGSIRKALKNAFGPSFGTVTFSGLVVAFVRMIRAAIDSSQNVQGQGCFTAMLRCCVNFALVSIEFLNKFTIIFAAISGESYCNSAKVAYDLLKRNLLSPVFVEVISTRLLGGMVFVLSVVYAVVVCAILRAGMNLGAIAYYVTVLAWLLLFVIFLLFCQVLDNIIDTVYICYAIDKDSGAVSKLEVHDVYLMLPVSRDQPPALAAQQA